MPFDLETALRTAAGQGIGLHEAHVNPRFAQVLKTIGFDRGYIRARGAHLWDDRGFRYTDMLAGYGVHNIGRNHPVVRQALADYLDKDGASLVQMDAPVLAGLLADALKKHMPNKLDRVYFANSGTEAVEAAIKFARAATGRPGILYATKAYHGLTMGALAINGEPMFREPFGPHLADCRRVPFDDLPALEAALRLRDVAAFVIEPIQGKGVNIPRPGYLADAARLCRRYDTLFVADEVQTGMGRTGKFLAVEHDGDVDPDIVVLSKALSGGYVPIGAVLTRRRFHDKVYSSLDRAVIHSSTFGQGDLAMVAGLATLSVIDEERLVERAAKTGARLLAALEALVPAHEFLKEVRGRGLMIGIEFGEPRSLSLRTAWTMAHRMDPSLFTQAAVIPLFQDHRMLTQVAGHGIDIIKLIPPLMLEEEDADAFVDAFTQVLAEMHKFPGPIWDVLTRLGRNALRRVG